MIYKNYHRQALKKEIVNISCVEAVFLIFVGDENENMAVLVV